MKLVRKQTFLYRLGDLVVSTNITALKGKVMQCMHGTLVAATVGGTVAAAGCAERLRESLLYYKSKR